MAMVQRNGTHGKTSSSLVEALLYTRVSKDEMAKEGLSLDAQLDDCRRYAASHGWIIGSEYQDVLSGKRDDRPQYQRMLADLRHMRAEGKQVVVVVKWLHRLGRRVLERVRSREEMKALGVPLHSIAEGGEVSDLVANILASVAEEEVRQLGERVQSVNRHLARIGWARPGRATWGYRWRPPTEEERANGSPKAVLDVDPEGAPFVREAYRRAASGESVRSVLRWVGSLPSSARSEKKLNHRSIQMILSSPTYIACTDVEGELLPGRWPALIDRATWNRVQERTAGHSRVPHQASGRYLLTGFLRCPRCGSRMHGTTNSKVLVYRCSGIIYADPEALHANCHYCAGQPVVDTAVLSQVSTLVEAMTTRDEAFQIALRRAWRQLQQPSVRADAEHRIAKLERERDRARDRLRKAALKLVDGELDRDGYELAREAAQADLEAAEAELERVVSIAPAANLPPLSDVLRELGGWSQVLGEADGVGRRDVLALLIEQVTPVRIGYAKYDVRIQWTPLGQGLQALLSLVGAN